MASAMLIFIRFLLEKAVEEVGVVLIPGGLLSGVVGNPPPSLPIALPQFIPLHIESDPITILIFTAIDLYFIAAAKMGWPVSL